MSFIYISLALLLAMTWFAWRARSFWLLIIVTMCWALAIRSTATHAWGYAGSLWSSLFGS
jgi:hypothetical protein